MKTKIALALCCILTGCSAEPPISSALNEAPSFYLEECAVRAEISWVQDVAPNDRDEALLAFDALFAASMSGRELPLTSYTTGAPYEDWWFFLKDRCPERESLISGILTVWVDATPWITAVALNPSPDLGMLDSRPSGWWKVDE